MARKKSYQHPLVARLRGQIIALEHAAAQNEISGAYSGQTVDGTEEGENLCDVIRDEYQRLHERTFKTLRELNEEFKRLNNGTLVHYRARSCAK